MPAQHEKERKEKTTPFGVNLTRSLVIYRTAQHVGSDLPAVMQDFLNGVCTHIIWLTKQKLTYYTGNFDTYTKTVKENEVIQQKKYEKEQDDIKHLKAFISSCGTLNFH